MAQESMPFKAQCTAKALAATKPLPQLAYECPADLNDSDESVLKLPARMEGLRKLTAELESFTNPAWWQTEFREFKKCLIKRSTGEQPPQEKYKI